MPVIYVDVLLAVNLIVDYFLLRLCGALLHASASRVRILAGAGIGAIGSLLLLWDMPVVVGMMLKCVLMSGMTGVAFGCKGLHHFIRINGLFFGINFAFAGLMLFVWYKFLPEKIMYKNGAVYCNIDLTVLVLSTVICYTVLTLLAYISQKHTMRGTVYSMEIYSGDNMIKGKALYDTGNTLRDGFSGFPVVIINKDFGEKIYPTGFREFIYDNYFTDTGQGFRLIPFSTLGKEGVLPAFRAKKVRYFTQGKWMEQKNVFIAVSQTKIGGGEFDMLFGTPLFQAECKEVVSK